MRVPSRTEDTADLDKGATGIIPGDQLARGDTGQSEATADDQAPAQPRLTLEEMQAQIESSRQELEQYRSDLEKERELRLRTEGMLQAQGGRTGTETASEEQVRQAHAEARTKLRDETGQWLDGFYPKGIEATSLAPEALAEFEKVLIEEPQRAAAWIDKLVSDRVNGGLQAVKAALADYHSRVFPDLQFYVSAAINDALNGRDQSSRAETVARDAFDYMYEQMYPHLMEHYDALPNVYKKAFLDRAVEIADDVARQMSRNDEYTRVRLISELSAQGRNDLVNQYLQRVGSAIERDANVAPGTAGNGRPVGKAGARGGQAGGRGKGGAAASLSASGRSGATQVLNPAAEGEDLNPIASIIEGEDRFGY